MESRWREGPRDTRILDTRPPTNHATPCDACHPGGPSAPGPKRCPRSLRGAHSNCGHLCPKSRPVTRRQRSEGLSEGPSAKPAAPAPAPAAPVPPGYQRCGAGLARGVATSRGDAARPRGPPRPRRPSPVLRPDHTVTHGSPAPAPAESRPGSFPRPSPRR